ncbi:MAG: SH3 domain-containing protein [Desulfovibrio sp.]|nr:MAG: SH3 domain-containing protein [Desulfovibrio sp.]
MHVYRFAALILLVLLLAACTVRTETRPQSSSPPPRYESVTVDSLNVRSGPGMEHGVIEVVHRHDSLEIYGREGNWINVRTPLNQVGWTYGAYLTGFDIPRPSQPSGANDSGVESEEFIPPAPEDVPAPGDEQNNEEAPAPTPTI